MVQSKGILVILSGKQIHKACSISPRGMKLSDDHKETKL